MAGGGNWEFQMYVNSRKNSYVHNGQLHIKPTLTSDEIGEAAVLNGGTYEMWGGGPADSCTNNAFYGCSRQSNGVNIINPIQSARLRTAESFSFKYGRVEVRARLPRGDWMWPAIWMMPKDNAYGTWPASGEIDIMESRGNTGKGGVSSVGSTMHWGPGWNQNAWPLTHAEYTAPVGDFASSFHTYGLYWDEHVMYTYVDNDSNRVLYVNTSKSFFDRATSSGLDWTTNPWMYSEAKNAPFDQEFYLLLNVAVGGVSGYFPDAPNKPWSDASGHAALDFWQQKSKWYPTWTAAGDQAQMSVDWVKVYAIEDDSVVVDVPAVPVAPVASSTGLSAVSSTGAAPTIILPTLLPVPTNTSSAITSTTPTTIKETTTTSTDLTTVIVAAVVAAFGGCIVGAGVVFGTLRYLEKRSKAVLLQLVVRIWNQRRRRVKITVRNRVVIILLRLRRLIKLCILE